MNISSRTPEGSPNRCPVCGHDLRLEPSQPPGDAPCPACGSLLWFPLQAVAACPDAPGASTRREPLSGLQPRPAPGAFAASRRRLVEALGDDQLREVARLRLQGDSIEQ